LFYKSLYGQRELHKLLQFSFLLHRMMIIALTNYMACYIGDNEKTHNEYKNKVIHSDAVSTDLDIN